MHIGLHKTGSSSLQKYLIENTSQLYADDWAHFCATPSGRTNSTGTVNPWVKIKADLGSVSASLQPGFAAAITAAKPESGNVVLSGEYLCLLDDANELGQLAQELGAEFDDVLIVVYLRRQDKQAVSHHQQASKWPNIWESRYYGHNNGALPHASVDTSGYHNYYNVLTRWADEFGDKSIVARIFERSDLINGDIIDDFCQVLDIPAEGKRVRVNESLGRIRTLLSHLMITAKVPMPLFKMLKQRFPNHGKLLPSRLEASRFLAKFSRSNEKLNDRFKISRYPSLFDTDLSMYPEEGNHMLTADEANSALMEVLECIGEESFLTSDDAKLVRNAAVILSETKPKLAKKLLLMAQASRPNDASIKKKLLELS